MANVSENSAPLNSLENVLCLLCLCYTCQARPPRGNPPCSAADPLRRKRLAAGGSQAPAEVCPPPIGCTMRGRGRSCLRWSLQQIFLNAVTHRSSSSLLLSNVVGMTSELKRLLMSTLLSQKVTRLRKHKHDIDMK